MKRLPFFKFDTDDWLTGKIQCCTAAEKGTFIDLCSMIWRENGQLKITPTLERQLRVAKGTLSDALGTFSELGIMECKDDILSVKFIIDGVKGLV